MELSPQIQEPLPQSSQASEEKVEEKEESPEKPVHYLVTRKEILMGRDSEYPLNATLEANLGKLLVAVNKLRQKWGKPLIVSSGYRPGRYNKIAGGASKSLHTTCEAVDFYDPKQELSGWLMKNQQVLHDCGLWMESPTYTKTWCHVDLKPRHRRVFIP